MSAMFPVLAALHQNQAQLLLLNLVPLQQHHLANQVTVPNPVMAVVVEVAVMAAEQLAVVKRLQKPELPATWLQLQADLLS